MHYLLGLLFKNGFLVQALEGFHGVHVLDSAMGTTGSRGLRGRPKVEGERVTVTEVHSVARITVKSAGQLNEPRLSTFQPYGNCSLVPRLQQITVLCGKPGYETNPSKHVLTNSADKGMRK